MPNVLVGSVINRRGKSELLAKLAESCGYRVVSIYDPPQPESTTVLEIFIDEATSLGESPDDV